MRGFPKNFSTKFDVDYCLENYPEETRAKLQEYAENSYCTESKPLHGKEEGLVDELNRVEVQKDGTKLQITRKIDPNCKLVRLGIMVDSKSIEDNIGEVKL